MQHRLVLADLPVLDLDELTGLDRVAQRRDQLLLGLVRLRRGRLLEIELAERLLELLAHAVERPVRLGGDHRPDELEREPDRTCFQGRQSRRRAERVAEELLVDADLGAAQLRVDGVTAAAEIDEVEQGEMLLDRLLGDLRETLDEVAGGDDGARLVTARGEEVREQRLEHPEALRVDGTGGPLRQLLGHDRARLGRHGGGRGVDRCDAAQAAGDLAAQRVRLEWHRAAVEPQDPGGEVRESGVGRDEDVLLHAPVRRSVRALDPPGSVPGELDPRLADRLAHLPGRRRPMLGGVEVLWQPEVALAAGRELDVARGSAAP